MNTVKKRISIFILGLFSILLFLGGAFFYFTPTEFGYIANISTEAEGKGTQILVVEDISKYKKLKNNVFATYENEGTIFQLPWYVPANKLKPEQKVKIYFDGKVQLTSPGRANAYWIKVIK
ncbi:DUF3221 domain-containing protein [Bacillus sp. FJAT-42315]|uniref:DUF3221 domain-containing protein n=1 Tax=Bacillus sp. FJAT-42315 TaxID=2014077 RepID=UPI000C249558|nr:DUF3221 domain-containing protein [Bacillus sp. FJAT-42315]